MGKNQKCLLLRKEDGSSWIDIDSDETKIDSPYNLRPRKKKNYYQTTRPMARNDKKNIDKNMPNLQSSIKSGKFSQPSKHLSKWEKLKWLHQRRDTGVWIQCSHEKCGRWRYVEEYHEPVVVPEVWICSMNPDKKYSSCVDPQDPTFEYYDEDLIENEFNAGSLVWARVNGYPWWPAMIDDCPETLNYYELKGSSIIPIRYHVTFFEEHPLRSWLSKSSIKPLKEEDTRPPVKKPRMVYKGINYGNQLKECLQAAKSAIPLAISERLKKFSFCTRFAEAEAFVELSKETLPKEHQGSQGLDVVPSRSNNNFTSSSFDMQENLAAIEEYVNFCAQDYKKKTGKDLCEETRCREEIYQMENDSYNRLYFKVEYKNQNEPSSQDSLYSPDESDFVLGSQPENNKYKAEWPEITLEENSKIDEILRAIFPKSNQ